MRLSNLLSVLILALSVEYFIPAALAAEKANQPQPSPASDRRIKEEIEQRLFWSPLVDDSNVRVRVTNGVAVLTGAVKGWDSFGAAIEKALEGGAQRVRVRLTVPGFAFRKLKGGGIEAWIAREDRDKRRNLLNDVQLKKKIEQQLYWSPFVDRNRIQVQVQRGAAVLTGSADDWSSHGQATENAFEAGAVVVRNLMTVEP